MKKFGLILGLVSSVLFCTSCTSNSNPNLSVAEASRSNGIVLLNYSFEDNGKPFVDDGRYIKWFPEGFYKALFECRDMEFSDVLMLDKESTLSGQMKDGKLIKGDVMRRYQCIIRARN